MNIINWLLCKVYGHRRGRRIPASDSVQAVTGYAIFRCPRCNADRVRRVKAQPAPNVPASIRKTNKA